MSFLYSCIGGEGGNGGNGKPGKSNLDKIPMNPTNAQDVYNQSPQVNYVSNCLTYCYIGSCELCEEYWYHALDITTNACGGNGGNGGNGGDGGAAGSLTLIAWKTMNSNVEIINTRLRSNGGSSGSGGVQASGLICNRHFTGFRRRWFTPGCHGYGNFICGPTYYEAFGGYGYTNNDIDCPGLYGANGIPGNNWEP